MNTGQQDMDREEFLEALYEASKNWSPTRIPKKLKNKVLNGLKEYVSKGYENNFHVQKNLLRFYAAGPGGSKELVKFLDRFLPILEDLFKTDGFWWGGVILFLDDYIKEE